MAESELETILKDLPKYGVAIKQRPYRQVWRFQAGGKACYLKFYPRPGSRLKRMIRGNPAMREFLRLQWLQKAKIPAPRALAVLSGYVLDGVKGDAVLTEAIEPSITLDRYLNEHELAGTSAPDHRALSVQIRKIVQALGQAKYGHDDLHLGNFLRREDGAVFLLDAYAVTTGGLKMEQILRLGHSVARYGSRSDIRRAWDLLAPERPMPRRNSVSPRIWRKFLELTRGDNRYFGKIASESWSGIFFKNWKYRARWAPASRLDITEQDWQREWPLLLQQMRGDLLESLKSSRSGDVWAGQVTLAGRPVEIVVKRPRRKHWYRYINEIGRGARAARAWKKAWSLVARNLPTAWPLLVMERRVLGYTVEQVLVTARVPGKTLATADLDAMSSCQRDLLFRRCGKMLRRIEATGLVHFDPKSSNWIVLEDDLRGPTPVLVDVDGVRFYRWDTFGIRRLLRAMREHPQYTVADSLSLCRGYAPFTHLEQEPGEPAPAAPAKEGT